MIFAVFDVWVFDCCVNKYKLLNNTMQNKKPSCC